MKRKKLAIITASTVVALGLGLGAAYGGLFIYVKGLYLPYTSDESRQCLTVAERFEDKSSLDINQIIGPENGSEMAMVHYHTETQLGLPAERVAACYFDGPNGMRAANISTLKNGKIIDDITLDLTR